MIFLLIALITLTISSCSGSLELLSNLNSSLSPTTNETSGTLVFTSGQSYNFGNKSLLTTTSSTLTLLSSGTANSIINAVTTSTPFSVSGGTCSVSSTITNSGSCTVDLYYKPTAVGNYNNLLQVSYVSNSIIKTTTITLSGKAGTPAQSFALLDASDDTASEINPYLNMNSVDGVAVRTSWATLQPTSPSSYTWTSIDNAFAAAKAANKKVTLHILSSVYSSPPSWLYLNGGVSYTYTKPTTPPVTVTDPHPWNATNLSFWNTFLNALSSHLNSQNYISTLEFISVGYPVPEMSLIGCINGDLNGANSGYGPGSYDRMAYLDSWKKSVSATITNFPYTKILLPTPGRSICRNETSGDNGLFYSELLTYAKSLPSGGIYHYATDLNASGTGSVRMDQIATVTTNVVSQASIGFQYTWSYSQDDGIKMLGTLNTSTCTNGIKKWSATYFEVYKNDLDSVSSTIQTTLENIHNPWDCP